MGESYKMRNLLEYFYGKVRIVGFREHIFSSLGGIVAEFAASNEFVFGTNVQRFMTWPLRVRFHYGHPDVWDKVWAFSSGGVSKASRTLHVSEDIFGGINVVLRGGAVEYYEFIHCGKGRDMGFIAVNGFEQKISTGNACSVRAATSTAWASSSTSRLFSFYSRAPGSTSPPCSRSLRLLFTLAQLASPSAVRSSSNTSTRSSRTPRADGAPSRALEAQRDAGGRRRRRLRRRGVTRARAAPPHTSR